jgi:hypothetical protein
MIVWFNCKISDVRLNTQPRYFLRPDNRLDIAKYSFASFATLEPLVSKFIFNLEMADAYRGLEKDMEKWISSILPEDKVELNWYRCNNKAQWEEVRKKINAIDDPLVFPAGNEDHIFMDPNTYVFAELLELVSKDPNPNAVIATSHWPECIRAAYYFQGIKQGNSVRFKMGNNDAIRVIKKEFFNWYVDILSSSMMAFRTEHWNSIALPENIMYVPTKEQFRHFDGYAHVGINAEVVPPLEIPLNYFQNNVVVKYGLEERDSNCVNINPMTETLYAHDGKGTDYKWCLNDIPKFWNADVILADKIDLEGMNTARNNHLLTSSRLSFDWPHFSVIFDNINYPPIDWFKPHMLSKL